MGDRRASFVLFMILFSVIVIFPDVEIVKAESTIYVRADGSVDPLTAPISTFDNITYTLTDDVYDSIVVERNNIVIDGNGYTLQGTGNGTGIDLTDREKVMIKNTQINNFEFCIRLIRSDNIIISANNVTTSYCGVWLSDSSNSIVSENRLISNTGGIDLYRTSNITVSANNITDNYDGIRGSDVEFVTITENTITRSTYRGISISNSLKSTILGNTLTSQEYGVDIYKASECTVSRNSMIDGGFGFAGSQLSSSVISENTITNSRYGVYFWDSSDSNISGNTITNSAIDGISLTITSDFTISNNSLKDSTYFGIEVLNSSSTTIYGNTLTDNYNGIHFWNVSYTTISGNNITGNTNSGIRINEASNCIVTENTLTDNYDGITLYNSTNSRASRNIVTGSRLGISSYLSSNITISGNTLTDNRDGFYNWYGSYNTVSGNRITDNRDHGILHGESNNTIIVANTLSNNGDANRLYLSSHVTVSENYISGNFIGFLVLQSSNNTFYHNNFVNNNVQIFDDTTNIWDNGFPSGGNYWSDYTERYPDAEELNGSAIWDTPYVIDEENQDNYPLMQPYSYKLVITTTGGGTTDPPAETYSYPAGAGSLVNITAFPNTGCSFDYWLLDSEEIVNNPITLIMDGNHTLEAYFVDVTPPTTSNDYDGTWQTSDFTITLSAIDNESGIAETFYRINGEATKTVSADGQPLINTEGANNTLEYWSIDNAGNEETPSIITDIRLDKTAPLGSILINENATYTNSITVMLTLSADDTTSGVAQMRFSNDGTEWSNWETYSISKEWTISVADGTKTVYVQFKDNAGLVSESYQDTIILDATAPTADAGQDQKVKVDASVTFDASASSDNVGIVSYSWDFGDGTTATTETAIHVYNNTGTYTVTLTAEDAAGNVDTAQITVTVVSPELIPLWLIGVVAAVILVVVVTVFFMKRRKQPHKTIK